MMTSLFDKRYHVPQSEMHIVPIAWMFVVVLMTVAEATSTQGTVLGALITFVLYGLLPLAILMYLLGTPGRWRARRAAEQAERAAERAADASSASGDGGSQPATARRAPEREEL